MSTTSTFPYRKLALTPDVIADLAVIDPEGLLAEALDARSSRTLRKVVMAIAKAQATVVVTPEPEPEPTPEPKALKYGRTASGKAVSTVASKLAHEARAAEGGKLRDLYPQAIEFVLAHLDEF